MHFEIDDGAAATTSTFAEYTDSIGSCGPRHYELVIPPAGLTLDASTRTFSYETTDPT